LTSGAALDLSPFVVDYGFDFGECATVQACTTTSSPAPYTLPPLACSVANGARKLADYIVNVAPDAPGNVVLVGYSMGGLISRNLLVNGNAAAYQNVLASHPVLGLITLGTPHSGYAYLPVDTSSIGMCPQLAMDMAGAWTWPSGTPNQTISTFLPNLNASWTGSSYGQYWLAAAGRFCTNPTRYNFSNPGSQSSTGCLEGIGVNSNDGIVCADSAEYSYFSSPGPTGKPTAVFDDPNVNYSHTNTLLGYGTALMMGCQTSSSNRLLDQPAPGDPLFSQIVGVINGH
jgi:PGAP1-like protein